MDGVRRPGYFARLAGNSGQVTMNWFYDNLYHKPAGSILTTYAADTATYSGPITFYSKTGVVTGTGTATLK